jgi:hypothetical protein
VVVLSTSPPAETAGCRGPSPGPLSAVSTAAFSPDSAFSGATAGARGARYFECTPDRTGHDRRPAPGNSPALPRCEYNCMSLQDRSCRRSDQRPHFTPHAAQASFFSALGGAAVARDCCGGGRRLRARGPASSIAAEMKRRFDQLHPTNPLRFSAPRLRAPSYVYVQKLYPSPTSNQRTHARTGPAHNPQTKQNFLLSPEPPGSTITRSN